MTSDKLVFGVVGGRGRGAYLASLYAEHELTELKAIADCDASAFEEGREKYNLEKGSYREYASVKEMLARESLEWLLIASPDDTHFDLTLQGLNAGCHCFVEKPMCQTLEQADEVCRAQRRTGKTVVVGCELRYTQAVSRFRKLLRDGAIGKVILGQCIETQARGHGYFRRKYRHRSFGSPPLLQKGIHLVDLVQDLVGTDPVKVSASGGLDFYGRRPETDGRVCGTCPDAHTCAFHPYTGKGIAEWKRKRVPADAPPSEAPCVFDSSIDVEDNAMLLVDYANGARVSIADIYFAPENKREVVFHGTKGFARLRMVTRPVQETVIEIHRMYEEKPERIDIPHVQGGHGGGDPGLRDALVAAARKGGTVSPTCEEARAGIATILMALRSMSSGRAEPIPSL